jgi:hypothetical protein
MSMELSHVWQGNVFFLKTHYAVWRHLSNICISKSKILTYRNDNKVLENKLHYDFKWTLQLNHKKILHRHFKLVLI